MFQDKESDKYKIKESCYYIHYHYSSVVGENTNTNHGVNTRLPRDPKKQHEEFKKLEEKIKEEIG